MNVWQVRLELQEGRLDGNEDVRVHDDLRIEDSGGQLNEPHYSACVVQTVADT